MRSRQHLLLPATLAVLTSATAGAQLRASPDGWHFIVEDAMAFDARLATGAYPLRAHRGPGQASTGRARARLP